MASYIQRNGIIRYGVRKVVLYGFLHIVDQLPVDRKIGEIFVKLHLYASGGTVRLGYIDSKTTGIHLRRHHFDESRIDMKSQGIIAGHFFREVVGASGF